MARDKKDKKGYRLKVLKEQAGGAKPKHEPWHGFTPDLDLKPTRAKKKAPTPKKSVSGAKGAQPASVAAPDVPAPRSDLQGIPGSGVPSAPTTTPGRSPAGGSTSVTRPGRSGQIGRSQVPVTQQPTTTPTGEAYVPQGDTWDQRRRDINRARREGDLGEVGSEESTRRWRRLRRANPGYPGGRPSRAPTPAASPAEESPADSGQRQAERPSRRRGQRPPSEPSRPRQRRGRGPAAEETGRRPRAGEPTSDSPHTEEEQEYFRRTGEWGEVVKDPDEGTYGTGQQPVPYLRRRGGPRSRRGRRMRPPPRRVRPPPRRVRPPLPIRRRTIPHRVPGRGIVPGHLAPRPPRRRRPPHRIRRVPPGTARRYRGRGRRFEEHQEKMVDKIVNILLEYISDK